MVKRRLKSPSGSPDEANSRAAASGEADADGTNPDADGVEQLTSADIFGDVLAEVEAEARGARPAASGSVKSAAKPSRPRGDIERRLEETLSGVIPLAGRTRSRRPRGTPEARDTGLKPGPEAEIDTLLDQTLSSLDIPARSKRTPGAATPIGERLGVSANTSREGITGEVPSPPLRETAAAAALSSEAVPGHEPDVAMPAAPSGGGTAAVIEPPPAPAPMPADVFDQAESEDAGIEEGSAAASPSVPAVPVASTGPGELAKADAKGPVPSPEARASESVVGQVAPLTSLEELDPEANQFRTQPLSRSDFAIDFAAAVSERRAASVPSENVAFQVPDGGMASGLPSGDATSGSVASGEVFGDYTLLDRIAVGGMAEVWRAQRRGVEGFQKIVAIKKILSHLTGSQDFVTMFIDEAKLAAQLSHNNIIQIYDLGKVGDDFFIAMEHVEGKDLRSILTAAQESNRPIPLSLGLLIISAVARALDYAHRKRDFDNRAMGLVHRDVSPQNVMISYEGAIKLCDFGIVKAVAKASTTKMGALKGKLQYMSPEQAWGKSVDARSDIFSLGSVFYEVLTGSQLFSGESEISVLDAVRECQISSPRELVPEIPEEVARIVGKALAKSPDERFQKAGDLEHEIRAALDNLRPTSSQKDLADYLHELFDMPKSGVVAVATAGAASQDQPLPAEPQAESFIVEQPAMVEPVAESPTAEAPVSDQPAADGTSRPGRWKWLAAAILAAMLASVGFFAWSSLRKTEDGAMPATDPAPSVETITTSPTPTVSPAPLEDATAASDDDPTPETATVDRGEMAGRAALSADPEAAATDTADSTAPEPAEASPESGPAVTAAGIDIEQMVNEELTSRAEQLRRDFEAEKKRIEEELARTQKESSKPDQGDGDGDGGESDR